MKKIISSIIGALAGLVMVGTTATSPANASLIFGGLCDGQPDENVTCDLNTGREWQDLDSTIGLSPNDFFSDVGGWLTAGWSWSLASDVESFMENAGFTDFTGQILVSQFDAAQLLTSLMGLTNGGMGGDFSQAFADNGDGRATELFFRIRSANAGEIQARADTAFPCCRAGCTGLVAYAGKRWVGGAGGQRRL